MRCIPLLYLAYIIAHTARSQLFSLNTYLALPFETHVFLTFILLFLSNFFGPYHPYSQIIELISTGESASKSMSTLSVALQVHIIDATKTNSFREHFNNGRVHVKQFLTQIMSSIIVPEEQIRTKLSEWAKSLKLKLIEISQFSFFTRFIWIYLARYWVHFSLMRSMSRKTFACVSFSIFYFAPDSF